jgi:hypothetical protein
MKHGMNGALGGDSDVSSEPLNNGLRPIACAVSAILSQTEKMPGKARARLRHGIPCGEGALDARCAFSASRDTRDGTASAKDHDCCCPAVTAISEICFTTLDCVAF